MGKGGPSLWEETKALEESSSVGVNMSLYNLERESETVLEDGV